MPRTPPAVRTEVVLSEANRDMIEHWNALAGPAWVTHQERLDHQIRRHGERVLEALALAAGERVLDVGCGCGDTTLEMARRVGPGGEVVGVDVSAPMLERARARAHQAGLPQAGFVQADAQSAHLGEETFDAVGSRFGVMFFEHPEAAFRNLGRALRRGGRLAFVCWQAPQRNPWIMVPMAAVASHLALPPPPAPGTPGMFSLADPDRLRAILGAAGLGAISLEELHLPVALGGGSLDDAVRLFLEVGPVAALLRQVDGAEALREKVAGAVREALERHAGGGPLELGSAAWLATARRPA